MNRLNKDLILVNMEKSRMQLEVDQLRWEIKAGERRDERKEEEDD